MATIQDKLTGCGMMEPDFDVDFALTTLYSNQLGSTFSDLLVETSVVGVKPLPFIGG